MKVVCSYCRKDMGEKPPLEDTRASHSMCPECHDWFKRGNKPVRLQEHLDYLHVPLFVTNSDGRIVGMNDRLATMLGVDKHEVEGLLGGEAFLCVYSRLPEGCGRTTHCLECTIRNTVMATLDTGEPSARKTTYLVRKEGTFEVVLSTKREDGLVWVQVHSMQLVSLPSSPDGASLPRV